MKLTHTSLTLVALLLVPVFSSQDESTLATQIANTLGYPASKLTTTDESARYAEKTNGQALAVLTIRSTDETFAPLAVAIGKQGTLLKPELEADCQEKIKDGSTTVKRFEIKGGIHGYAGLGMAGPGGSEERMLATWPERGIDLQIKITTPREGVEFDQATKSYHELIMNGGPQIPDKLIQCMEHLVEHTERANIRSTNTIRQPETSRLSLPATQNTHPHRSPATAPTPASITPREHLASSTSWSIIVVLIAAATGLLWWLVKSRK